MTTQEKGTAMKFYYLCRDVEPGADCSYPAGRTLLREGGMRTEKEAQLRADTYNRFCHVPGVHYLVVPHEDDQPFEADHYEASKGWEPCPYETIIVEE